MLARDFLPCPVSRQRVELVVCALAWLLGANRDAVLGQFTTVVNSPPTIIGSLQSIGSNTQLNVFDGGLVGSLFNAGSSSGTNSNIEVNVYGGTILSRFRAYNGSVVNVAGGVLGDQLEAFTGSVINTSGGLFGQQLTARNGSTLNVEGGNFGNSFTVNSGGIANISGGAFGDALVSTSGSHLHLFGGEFRLNNEFVPGLESIGNSVAIDLPAGSLLSGTLADGTPFVFSTLEGDAIANATLTLHMTVLPTGMTDFEVPNDAAPLGVHNGQTLTVQIGGIIGDNFNAGAGSTVNIQGGAVGRNFEAIGANVSINGGTVGHDFDAFSGSLVSIAGGVVGGSFQAYGGSTVNITGGMLDGSFNALTGSAITIGGGLQSDGFSANTGSNVSIIGGEFRRNGVIINGLNSVGDTLQLNLSSTDLLSGTLADGTPFAFSGRNALDAQDFFASGTLTLRVAALPSPGPPLINVPNDPAPASLREGQTLIVDNGGVLTKNFSAGRGSTVIVNGGEVLPNFEAVSAMVTISGGTVGTGFDAYRGSIVNISGGTIGSHLTVDTGTIVNISGGVIGYFLTALSGSEVNISGGAFEDTIYAKTGSQVTLSGSDFRLNGQLVAGLGTVGNTIAFDIPDEAVLTCTLADGTPFANSDQDDGGFLWPGTLRLKAADVPAAGPAVINVPIDLAPLGVRQGQTLIVNEGGFVGDNFNAGWGSTVILSAGQIGENFEAAGAHVIMSGGTVGPNFDSFYGSLIEISGGTVGPGFYPRNGSVVRISGGTILNELQ